VPSEEVSAVLEELEDAHNCKDALLHYFRCNYIGGVQIGILRVPNTHQDDRMFSLNSGIVYSKYGVWFYELQLSVALGKF